MYRISLATALFFVIINTLSGQIKTEGSYISPVKAPFSFSGGFGELRRNHFHTGLDFRTAGQTGMAVYAVKDGSVGRIYVSPSGYGLALYLAHEDGRTTVYGHLSRFHPKIESYVIEQQYRLKKFAVDLAIPAGLFVFKKGEIIAWSGNSGSSGGPHLHFEIRDTKSEKPQNPLFFLPGIQDKSTPRITSLYLYPLSPNSHVNKSQKKMRVETVAAPQKTSLKDQPLIEVFGDIGLGIQTTDDFNGTGMKCGIYSVELFEDQEPVHAFKLDHLVFDQGRYINSHIDYEELIKNKRWIHRLYLQPGNRMDIYQTNPGRGAINMTDGKIHDIRIVVADAFGNRNIFSFKLASKKYGLPEPREACTKLFRHDQSNEFENEEVKIKIPEGALYDRLPFDYHSVLKKASYFSKIHQIHNQYVPVHKPYMLSVKSESIPQRFQSKALIVLVDPAGNRSAVGGEYQNGWVTAYPRGFGTFGIVLDTIPPTIRSLSIQNNKLLNQRKIAFKIADNLSGIAGYEGEIDGNWVLFAYDAKTG
ncbi:MAG TPA: M23 family metallopeptidase, partial [Prolixibacteraceae bacterium]|nr:M23 family metallopeptidase [Prolixibacteraceae bacterium]